jgi:hypothetical protein
MWCCAAYVLISFYLGYSSLLNGESHLVSYDLDAGQEYTIDALLDANHCHLDTWVQHVLMNLCKQIRINPKQFVQKRLTNMQLFKLIPDTQWKTIIDVFASVAQQAVDRAAAP